MPACFSPGGRYAASAAHSLSRQPPPSPSRSSSIVARAELALLPSRTWTWRTSTSTRLLPRGIRLLVSHQLTRSNHLTGSAPTSHSLPRLSTAVGLPSLPVRTITCSILGTYVEAPTIGRQARRSKKPRTVCRSRRTVRGLTGGSYRDRTDDIHGVNVALYQLS